MSGRVLITGIGAICATGVEPEEIWAAARAGRSAIAPLSLGGPGNSKGPLAAVIADLNPRAMVEDRKVLKLLRRTDLLGLYAARKAIDQAGIVAARETLDQSAIDTFNDRTAVYVGSGGCAYQNQYDFFPLMTAAAGDLVSFGRELNATVNPMWLLQTLPNNVLCHLGIRYGFKGPNACITNLSVSGPLAVAEAAAALKAGEADRAVAVGHDAPVEPQTILYFQALGLLGSQAPRPFDQAHDGSVIGEGAAALILEAEEAAKLRGARVLGEHLGAGCTSEAQGLLPLRPDGDGLARAIALAFEDAGIRAGDVGMIVAHGNGTPNSDTSEAAAIRRVFGPAAPPVTSFKWSFGHLLTASGIMDIVLALMCLRRGEVPGIATFSQPDPDCAGIPLSASPQMPRSDIAMVLSRGSGGMSTAVLMRASLGEAD